MMNRNDAWTPADHQAVLREVRSSLWRFVRKNARIASPLDVVVSLTGLGRDDLDALLTIHYLLDPRTQRFINSVPAILQRLSRAGHTETLDTRDVIKGRIDWPRTTGARAAAGWDPHLYSVVMSVRTFDLHQNRVLKFLLKHIQLLSQRVTAGMVEDLGNWEPINPDTRSSWRTTAEHLGAAAAHFLRSVHLRDVTDLHGLTELDADRVAKVRGVWYRELEVAAYQYVEAAQTPHGYLERMLAERILEPLSRDDLFELWVLFRSLETLRLAGWNQTDLGLIGSAKGFHARLQNGSNRIRVHFQRLPSALNEASRYKTLMGKYGLGQSVRRPDIIIEFEDTSPKYLIVEVKRSRRRSYIADGTYKLIGYLSDFEEALAATDRTRGLLIVWDSVQYQPEFAGDRLVISSRHTVPQALADAIAGWSTVSI